MKCSVFINSDLIDQDDICIFNVHDDEIHFLLSGNEWFLTVGSRVDPDRAGS